MAGEKVAEAFVDIGGDLKGLKKALDDAARLSSSKLAGIGKNVDIGGKGGGKGGQAGDVADALKDAADNSGLLAGGAFLAGSALKKLAAPVALASTIAKIAGDATSMQEAIINLAEAAGRRGLLPEAITPQQSSDMDKMTAAILDISGKGLETQKNLFGAAAVLVEMSVGTADLAKGLEASVGFASKLDISLASAAEKVAKAVKGDIGGLDLPVSDIALPAEKFAAALREGDAQFKLLLSRSNTFSGRLGVIGTRLKDLFSEGSFRVADFFGMDSATETFNEIRARANEIAKERTGLSAVERAKRFVGQEIPGTPTPTPAEQAERKREQARQQKIPRGPSGPLEGPRLPVHEEQPQTPLGPVERRPGDSSASAFRLPTPLPGGEQQMTKLLAQISKSLNRQTDFMEAGGPRGIDTTRRPGLDAAVLG